MLCSGPSFGLSIDEISDSDVVLKNGDLQLFVRSPFATGHRPWAAALTIDFETHPVYGAGFSLLLANPSSGCGCGDGLRRRPTVTAVAAAVAAVAAAG